MVIEVDKWSRVKSLGADEDSMRVCVSMDVCAVMNFRDVSLYLVKSAFGL